ncbi:MAG: mandelate racemase/muconate lactonizing enzyme family protein [Sediminispirochaetaceae bacterium]
MKILRCEAWKLRLDLEEPFAIAYSTVDHTFNWFLRIETDTGLTGFGCSAYDEEVTGENEETIGSALNNTVIPLLQGSSLAFVGRIFEDLHRELSSQPTAAASADMALMDILARRADLPLYRMLGAFRDSIPTSVTIGIQDLDDTLRKARQWYDKGFSILKIKGGQCLEEDIERVRKLREYFGDKIELRFDANQGYSVEETLQFIKATAGTGIEFIEQPTSKDDPGAFRSIRAGRSDATPVMADEAVLGPEDALSLACGGSPDLYNIKLSKTGGIRRAMQLDAVAAAAGAGTMVGCMDEAGLGIAAGLHFALSSSNVRYADLDGHLELRNDPSSDAVRIRNGVIFPRDEAGLGFIM